MKLILLATVVVFVATGLVSGQSVKQNDTLEQKIRSLDMAQAEAMLRMDRPALEKLWAEDFTTNSPRNQIIKGRKELFETLRADNVKYSSLVRDIEYVMVHGNTVIVMGLETIIRTGDIPLSGQTVRRRFTNVWMKRKGKWQEVARHANVICQN
ncbi:MAG: nuclear transport factor 2 family protein [Acidobacteriota bacterium]|nr:nuclear transport factor 2 family protein [Acidobacteriota bacterium]